MMMFTFALIVLLYCCYVFAPFFSRAFKGKRFDFVSAEIENLNLRKQEILSAISDLEYDLKMKKMNPNDYQQIKDKLVDEGAAIMKALNKTKHPDSHSHPKPKHKRLKKAVA